MNKKWFIVMFCILSSLIVFCQEGESKPLTYKSATIGLGIGYDAKSVALTSFANIILKNNVYSGVHIMGTSFPTRNEPEDYYPGFLGGGYKPREHLVFYSALVGKRFQKSNLNFFSLEGGVSLMDYKKIRYTRKNAGMSTNYDINTDFIYKPGLMLNAIYSIQLSNITTFDVSLYGNINSGWSVLIPNASFAINLFKKQGQQRKN